MRRLSFRTRLTLLNAGLLTALLLLFSGGLIVSARQARLAEIDRELWDRGTRFVGQFQDGRPPEPGPRGPHRGFGMAPPRPPGSRPPPGPDAPWFRRPMVFRASGEALDPRDGVVRLLSAQLATQARDKGPLIGEVATEEGRYRVFYSPVPLPEGGDGLVQTAEDLTPLDGIWVQQWALMALFVPLAMALGALAGSFMARRALRPVESATLAAGAIEPTSMDRRLPVTGDDELARMAATFNAMLDRLGLSMREREAALESLRLALERERQFTADASHELRTPLAQIKLLTSLALSGPADPERDRETLRSLDQSADALTRLVNQLLTLARAETDGPACPSALENLADSARQALTSFPPDPRLALEIPETALGRMDPVAFERVVRNLLENALRFARQSVELRLAATEDGLELTVQDDGPGVPPELLGKLGERFFRPDAARSRAEGGTGLGLAIVRSLVQSAGGGVRFSRGSLGGLQVCVNLPGAAEGFRIPSASASVSKAMIPSEETYLEPWHAVTDAEERAALEREMLSEVGQGHPLFQVPCRIVARRADNDDVLALCSHPDGTYAVVHLTWGPHPDPWPGWPSTRFFRDWADLCQKELLPEHEDWRQGQ